MKILPKDGFSKKELEAQLADAKRYDADWRGGKMAYYVHFANDEVLEVAKSAYNMFLSENAAATEAFPSIVKFEQEIISMTLDLLNGGSNAQGYITTGGTESIFLAMQSARDRAKNKRSRNLIPFQIIVPDSAHPAYDKAANYLGMEVVRVPVGRDYCADIEAMSKAVTENTIVIVGSAPSFPYGLIDPIKQLAQISLANDLWLHVDACIGGFIAPFLKRLGYTLPDFDFSIPGVSSISVDLHKYGFAPKGISTILYTDKNHGQYQTFKSQAWPRGSYSTPGFVGTRSAGIVAAAWAVMNFLGETGYTNLAKRIVTVRESLESGLKKLGCNIVGQPQLGVIAYSTEAIAETEFIATYLRQEGWFSGLLTKPTAIHLMLTIAQEPIVDKYLSSVASALSASLKSAKRMS